MTETTTTDRAWYASLAELFATLKAEVQDLDERGVSNERGDTPWTFRVLTRGLAAALRRRADGRLELRLARPPEQAATEAQRAAFDFEVDVFRAQGRVPPSWERADGRPGVVYLTGPIDDETT